MIITLKNNCITAKINTVGAELISVISASEYEFIWQGSIWPKHAPVLFPICGMLKDGKYLYRGREYCIKKHGFANTSEFTVEDQTNTSLTLSIASDDSTHEMYPFDFKLTAKFDISENKLMLSLTVENTGNRILPYMIGWHPAFTLGGKQDINTFYVLFPEKKNLLWHQLQNGPFVNPICSPYPLSDSRYYLNEEEIYKNDTMIFNDVPTTVKLAGGDLDHSVTLSTTSNLKYLCIWKAPDSEARFICIEPWSNVPADGESPENFDLRDMSRLSVGDKESFDYTVIFE